jgi:carbamoyltransferase
MWVLGINWKFHDAAAALVDGDGTVAALAEEERYSRVKHAWGTLPRESVAFCLRSAGITWRDLDVVAIGWDLPQLGPWSDADKDELYAEIFGPGASGQGAPSLEFVEHHLAHACSAFYASGFAEAGVLVADGRGESGATSIYAARHGAGLTHLRHWPRVCSLGIMYEAAGHLLGFGGLEAGKTMGLAPYGVTSGHLVLPFGDDVTAGPHGNKLLLDLPPDPVGPLIKQAWIGYLHDRFGSVTAGLDDLDQDPVAIGIAASVQRTLEEAMRALHAETVSLAGTPNVCLAGGVALNCVSNGRLPEPVYIPPFPHDAGVSLGAAWAIAPPSRPVPLQSPYLGDTLEAGPQADRARAAGLHVEPFDPRVAAALLAEGAIGAVAEGRAEAGPRALGHRSIIALPRPAAVRDRINRLKGREPWRPLAPVTSPDYAPRLWPDQGRRALYMVGAATVSAHGQEVMPAVTHVDATTRPQVLPPDAAPIIESILRQLQHAGLPPVTVNTSLNGRGEPIIGSAAQAVDALHSLGLDFLILDEHMIRRA